jgi:hypothetical protein
MSQSFIVDHRIGERVRVAYGDHPLFTYEYAGDVNPAEAPKPYVHPLHSLRGDVITAFRPTDHPWHHGMAMTSAHLSGQNYWGGPTFVRDKGYQALENHGRQDHSTFESVWKREAQAGFAEKLQWLNHDGALWLAERREVTVDRVDPAAGFWTLSLSFSLHNVSGGMLEFGSPTTQGREQAGYGGLFWRGPRSFTGGTVLSEAGDEDMMGRRSRWIAFVGRHDGSTNVTTVAFADDPANPRHPTQWFVRTTPYACISAAFMFDQVLQLAADGRLDLRYRMLIADGSWGPEQIQAVL